MRRRAGIGPDEIDINAKQARISEAGRGGEGTLRNTKWGRGLLPGPTYWPLSALKAMPYARSSGRMSPWTPSSTSTCSRETSPETVWFSVTVSVPT